MREARATVTPALRMVISRDEVLTVARLSRLRLAEDEVERAVKELDSILSYVEKLNELNTEGVPPTLSVSVVRAPLRQDEPKAKPAFLGEEVFRQAPECGDSTFVVPAFVDVE